MIVGMSNAVNLTDGLDGLAIMPAALVAAALGVFAYASGNAVFANYLSIPADPGSRRSADLLRVARRRRARLPVVQRVSRAGVHGRHRRARHRRRASASIAVIVRQEIVTLVMGGVFVLETASVILQVGFVQAHAASASSAWRRSTITSS